MSRSEINFRSFYDRFNAPVVSLDCGKKCAPHNPNRKPFCCDICSAVPSVYKDEWVFLESNTNLWHIWRGDECVTAPENPSRLQKETVESMFLVACLGPDQCQREFRSLSCRQFPFFPYITADNEFIGLVYNWEFEESCWVMSNLDQVTEQYCQEFVLAYDELFSTWPDEMDGYAIRSEQMRKYFITQKRSIPILHRDGGIYLLRPLNKRLRKVDLDRYPKYGPYRE